jgi:hypothetical protein
MQAVYEYYKAQLPPPPPEAQFEAQGDEVFNVSPHDFFGAC